MWTVQKRRKMEEKDEVAELDDDDVKPLAKVTADFSGILKFGNTEIPCFVLSDKKRVIIMREVVNLLTGHRKGGLDRYTKATNLRPYMPTKFVDQEHKDVLVSFAVGNKLAYGYEAEDIIDI